MKPDIETPEDIENMVNNFYSKVNDDLLLSPIFNEMAEVDWPHHLPKMYQFWNFIILGIPGYKGQPFPPHTRFSLTALHFQKWLQLFKENVDDMFEGPNAEIAKSKAVHIAGVFQHKLGLTDFSK